MRRSLKVLVGLRLVSIQRWIETNLKPTKTFNDRRTSYGLKHLFEDTGGFYIGNGAFKGAMIKQSN